MNILKTIGRKAAGWSFPMLNWYKIGIYLLLCISWTVFIHTRATNNCELAHEKQKTEQAEKRAVEIVKHVETRLPVVQEKEIKAAVLKQNNLVLKDKIKEAINENPNRNSPVCALSNLEFDRVQQLIEQSKTATR